MAGVLPAAAAPVRLDYPAVGTSIPVGPLTPTAAHLAAHAIEPPETKDADWRTPVPGRHRPRIGKADLAVSPIWAAVPGRVVLITCDFNDPWGKNTVITADPSP